MARNTSQQLDGASTETRRGRDKSVEKHKRTRHKGTKVQSQEPWRTQNLKFEIGDFKIGGANGKIVLGWS